MYLNVKCLPSSETHGWLRVVPLYITGVMFTRGDVERTTRSQPWVSDDGACARI